jgi:hypothetical protein
MKTGLIQHLSETLNKRKAYKNIFTTEDGKIVLRHLCKTCCVTSPAFVAGDAQTTAYNNGKRDIVLAILRFVHANDDDIRLAIEEAYKQEQRQTE